jgi:hypothetical protein
MACERACSTGRELRPDRHLWWNTGRLLEPIGNTPPAEFEQRWRQSQQGFGGVIMTTDEPQPDDRLAALVT